MNFINFYKSMMARVSGQPAVEIKPDGKDRFENKGMNIRLEFRRGEDGRIIGFYLYQNGLKSSWTVTDIMSGFRFVRLVIRNPILDGLDGGV